MRRKVKVVQVVLYNLIIFFMFSKELKIKEIELIDDRSQGIYAWYLKPKTLNQTKLLMLYKRLNNFEIELHGRGVFNNSSKFGDSFNGNLARVASNKIEDKIKSLDNDFILSFLRLNSVPLYIGRSVNLRARLRKHYDGYLEAMSNNYISSFNENSDLDSEEESGYFGLRLANFNKEKWFSENELRIGIYEKKDIDYNDIKNIEYYLNRTYKPILGLI